MRIPTIGSLKRDLAFASAAVASLIASGLISGTAEKWTDAILAAVIAGLATFTNDNGKAAQNAEANGTRK